MRVEISIRKIIKVCVYVLSFLFIFPFLIIIGWHIRGYYDKTRNLSDVQSNPLRSDINNMDGGVIQID